jgi:hypothetical protein
LRQELGRLSGRVPGTPLTWSEALKLRVEYRFARSWLLIEPTVWVWRLNWPSHRLGPEPLIARGLPLLAWLFDQPSSERHDPPAAALRRIQPRKTVGPHASMSSSVLRRLVRQDKDLEVLGGVTRPSWASSWIERHRVR